MATNQRGFLSKIGIGEVISIGSIIVTVTLAWGVFGTRLTVLENDNAELKVKIQELKQQNAAESDARQKLEQRLRENENALGDLWKRR